jgi:hypothetical protein
VRRRGQATVELALAAPFIIGLLGLTLQGGVVLSDQVNLEHYAYEGAQWQLAHPDAPLSGSGSITEHIYQQMCNGASTSPVSGGTRYCTDVANSGLPSADNLSVTVTPQATPSSMARPAPQATAQVLAASTCKSWSLSVSPASATIGASATATFTVDLTVANDNTTEPIVTLSVSGLPSGMQNGTALFNPPAVSSLSGEFGTTSKLRLTTGANTRQGIYSLFITGQDQCGLPPRTPLATVPLNINGGGSFNPPPIPPLISVSAAVPICAGAVSNVKITGSGFQAGAVVKFGTTLAAGPVTFVNSGELDATVTLPPGVYDINVTNPDLSSATSASGLTVLPTTPCPPGNPTITHVCAGGAGGYEALIDIVWYEPLALPLLTSGSPPAVRLEATQYVTCQV